MIVCPVLFHSAPTLESTKKKSIQQDGLSVVTLNFP